MFNKCLFKSLSYLLHTLVLIILIVPVNIWTAAATDKSLDGEIFDGLDLIGGVLSGRDWDYFLASTDPVASDLSVDVKTGTKRARFEEPFKDQLRDKETKKCLACNEFLGRSSNNFEKLIRHYFFVKYFKKKTEYPDESLHHTHLAEVESTGAYSNGFKQAKLEIAKYRVRNYRA